jgi:hypothetical protein
VLQFSRKERETVEVATPGPSPEDIAQKSEGAEQSSSGTATTPRPLGRDIPVSQVPGSGVALCASPSREGREDPDATESGINLWASQSE